MANPRCPLLGLALLAGLACCQAACPASGSTDRCGQQAVSVYGAACTCASPQCCSQYGYCGPSNASTEPATDYCGQGCQSGFGICYGSASSPPPPLPPPPPPLPPPSPPPPVPPPPPPPLVAQAYKFYMISWTSPKVLSDPQGDTDRTQVYCKINGMDTNDSPSPIDVVLSNSGNTHTRYVGCDFSALPTDVIEVGFSIINLGCNENVGKIFDTVLGAVVSAANSIANLVTSTGSAGQSIFDAAKLEVGTSLGNLLCCDGLVAADGLKITGVQASNAVTARLNTYDRGYSSTSHCGKTSAYNVNWGFFLQ